MKKKLKLNKETIAKLSSEEMENIKGGGIPDTQGFVCQLTLGTSTPVCHVAHVAVNSKKVDCYNTLGDPQCFTPTPTLGYKEDGTEGVGYNQQSATERDDYVTIKWD